jgi:hypothetical protein
LTRLASCASSLPLCVARCSARLCTLRPSRRTRRLSSSSSNQR